MTETPHTRVIIAGGGLGGLTLAAGLLKRGIAVTVFERDTDLSKTGGYHIHLDAEATAALRDSVEPIVFERLLASSASTRLQGGDIMRDMRGRILFRDRPRDDDAGVNIDRITLRLILADAVGDALVRGAVVSGFAPTASGVTVTLEDGTEHNGDLLVGAEGPHSPIARELAGGPTNTPTGLIGIGGRTPVDQLPTRARELLGDDSGLAIGPGGTGLYVGYHDPVGQAAIAAPELASAVTVRPTYIWGAVLSESPQTEALRPLVGGELRDATVELLRRNGWTSPMLDVVTATEVDGLATFRFHAGSPDPTKLAPWAASRVTALGDAVHAMPPTAGMGAATAIQDAADLARRLGGVREGTTTIRAAVHAFEHGMRQRGAAAIALSLRPIGMIHATNSPVGRIAARIGLPIGAALAKLRR